MDGSSHQLRPAIKQGGMPRRTPDILKREEMFFSVNVQALAGTLLSKPADGPPLLDLAMLQKGFASEFDLTILNAATWLAGRVEPVDAGDKAVISQLVKDFIKARPLNELDIYTQAYVEAAFSLALMGDIKAGQNALVPIVTKYANPFGDSYLAAFYLAQMGNIEGYPAFLATLHGDTDHYRMMAARHLYGFQSYTGQKVKKVTVDPVQELINALHDRSEFVRAEIPGLLLQFNPPNLRTLLEPVTNNDPDENVRAAARHAIEHLDALKQK